MLWFIKVPKNNPRSFQILYTDNDVEYASPNYRKR